MIADALAAAASRLGDSATSVLARLGGPLGESARASFAALTALDQPARRRRRAEHAALARAASSPSLRMIHPTWIEAALASLPPRARHALAGGTIADPVDLWFARFATASLPPMPVTPHTDRERLVAREPAALVAWLDAIAADQIAHALGRPTRLQDLGSRRHAITRCHGLSLDDARALHVIASRALAPHLSRDPLTRLQLTRRMPYPVGCLVDETALSTESTTLEHAPPWSTLLAY